MKRLTKIALVVIAWCITAGVVGFVAIIWLQAPTNRVVAQWKQSANVHYTDFDPYNLKVLDDGIIFQHLETEHVYEIYLGIDPAVPIHGHLFRVSFYPDDDADIEKFIQKSQVEWTNDGVTFIEADGHRLFFPKAMFIGVR